MGIPAQVTGSAFLQREGQARGPAGGEGASQSWGPGSEARRGWSRRQGPERDLEAALCLDGSGKPTLTQHRFEVYILTPDEFPEPTWELG